MSFLKIYRLMKNIKKIYRLFTVKCKAVFYFFIILVFLQISVASAEPLKIIRDQEIEDLFKNISAPMFEKAGFRKEDINIIIVDSYGINAFVAGGKNIFINTGLILKAKNIEEILGVIAHELSHIAFGHLLRTKIAMDNISLQTLLVTIAGMAATILSGNNSGAGSAILKGGQAAAVSSFLKHSRGQETAADSGAVQYLEILEISPKGMVDFMNALSGEELLPQSQQSRYVRTHPLTQDRIDFLKRALEKSKYKNKKAPAMWQNSYDMVRAKLMGYINPRRIIEISNEKNNNYIYKYAKAIALYRLGKSKKSLTIIENLIKNNQNPYIYELKGQILLENGDIGAATSAYQKAVRLAPDAGLIQMAYAHALIEMATSIKNTQEKKATLQKAIAALQIAKRYEKHNSQLFKFLAIAYGSIGKEGLARLNLAEEALMQNRIDDAKRQLSYARNNLPKTSKQAFIRLQDLENAIIDREKILKKLRKKH